MIERLVDSEPTTNNREVYYEIENIMIYTIMTFNS